MTDTDRLREDIRRLSSDTQKAAYDRHTFEAQLGATKFAVDLTYTEVRNLAVRVEQLDSRVETLDTKVQQLDEKVDAGFSAIDERFTGIESVLEQILRRLPARD